jgi:hypothetical protein
LRIRDRREKIKRQRDDQPNRPFNHRRDQTTDRQTDRDRDSEIVMRKLTVIGLALSSDMVAVWLDWGGS